VNFEELRSNFLASEDSIKVKKQAKIQIDFGHKSVSSFALANFVSVIEKEISVDTNQDDEPKE